MAFKCKIRVVLYEYSSVPYRPVLDHGWLTVCIHNAATRIKVFSHDITQSCLFVNVLSTYIVIAKIISLSSSACCRNEQTTKLWFICRERAARPWRAVWRTLWSVELVESRSQSQQQQKSTSRDRGRYTSASRANWSVRQAWPAIYPWYKFRH